MLNCREITERASDFVDHTLPWRGRLQVRMHLMMCRFCREYIRQMALVARALRKLPGHGPSPEVQKELLSRFRAQRR
jgi:predicted anti-sigma-YlaC factor YlaD